MSAGAKVPPKVLLRPVFLTGAKLCEWPPGPCCGDPAISLVLLLAQAVPRFNAPHTQGCVGFGKIRAWPDSLSLAQFVIQSLHLVAAPASKLCTEAKLGYGK